MKLLFVDCCISQRGKESRTLALAKAYIDAFRAAHPDWEVERADSIVVAAPYWDLSYPAQLKTYIEHISVNGLCYHYTEQGCQGDCKAEKLVYLTSGGDFEGEDSVGVLHWKQLCKMFGIETFTYVFAGGMDIDPVKTPELLAQACEKARSLV